MELITLQIHGERCWVALNKEIDLSCCNMGIQEVIGFPYDGNLTSVP